MKNSRILFISLRSFYGAILVMFKSEMKYSLKGKAEFACCVIRWHNLKTFRCLGPIWLFVLTTRFIIFVAPLGNKFGAHNGAQMLSHYICVVISYLMYFLYLLFASALIAP